MTSETAQTQAKNVRPSWVAPVVLAAVALIAGLSWLALRLTGEDNPARQAAGETYKGTPLDGEAPDFTLVDHRGQLVILSGLRRNPLVLAFMDARCTDTCPLTALEFRTVHERLGTDRARVAFVAVNVNAKYHDTADVRAFTDKYRLDELTRWHFLTGVPDELRPVWSAYQIGVEEIPGKQEFQHTSGVYIIDAKGRMRWYVSTPLKENDLAAGWNGPKLRDILVDHIRQLLEEEG